MRIERKLKRAGFSLVEIVIAVALIGIMSAAAVPLIKTTMDKGRAGRAVSEIVQIKDGVGAAIVKASSADKPMVPADWVTATNVHTKASVMDYVTLTTDPFGGNYSSVYTANAAGGTVVVTCSAGCVTGINNVAQSSVTVTTPY